MAVRLYSEFSSSEGNRYKIEIHDSQWLAVATTFKVDGAGFQLTYDGETDDIISPIVSSKLSFGAYSENSTFETFISTLKTFQENRFRVVVYRSESPEGRNVNDGLVFDPLLIDSDETQYSLWWAGWITQDLVSQEDGPQPYIFQITATDGLGKLANINYDVANDITQGQGLQLTRLTQMMLNALKLAGLYDLWPSDAPFLETSADWWETTAHTYSTATDPLYLTAVDTRLLQSFDSDGTLQYNNALEALRQIATLFAGRIYLQAGRWVFEQYGQRASSTRYVSRYTYGGTDLGRTLVSDDIVLDQTTYAARKAGNNWDFLPAMRKAQVAYVQKFLNPFGFAGYRFFGTQSSGGFGGQFTAGFIAGGSGIQLGLGCAQFRFVLNGTVTGSPVVPIFRVRIRIKDVSTGTFYYYRRDFVSTNSQTMFGTPQWTTTDSWYYFDLKAFFMLNSPSSVNQTVQIWTEDLPVSGDLDFRFEFYDVVILTSSLPFTIAQAFFDGIFLFSTSTQGQNAPAGEIFTSVNNQAGIDSQLTLDIGEVFFAEGPLQTGHLAVYNGTNWVASNLWRKGSSGTGLRILKLLTSEALALHVRPIERYNGSTIGSDPFGPRYVFESTAYLRSGGTFTARMDEWDGELYAIQRIREQVTELDEVQELQSIPALGSSTTVGVSPNDLDAGRIGGMVVNEATQTIGPFQKVSTGGKVLGTLDVQQKITAEQDLEVIGTTTLDSVDVVDVVVSNDLDVTGSTTLGTLAAGASSLSSATVSGTLGVTGTSTLGTVSAGATTLASNTVTGNQTVGGTLGVTGTSTLGTLNAGASSLSSATVSGTLGVTGSTTLGTLNAGASSLSSATVSGTLGVTGTSTLGTVSAGATTLASSSVTGNQTVGGTLGVTGTSTLGTLNAGASTLASSSVTGNQTVGGTLGVTGTSTLGTVTAGATTLASNTVTGNQTVGGTLGVTGTTTLSSATVSSTLGVTGATTLGTLNAGASTLASSSVTGNQTVGGTLGVTGATTLGTLSAGASTLASSSVTGNQTVGGTLGVTGTSTLGTLNAGASTLASSSVTGNQTVGGTLGVTGASTLGTLSAGASTLSSASVSGTLGVTGASTLGTVTAGATTLASNTVTGNQTVGGSLDVAGPTELIGATRVVESLQVDRVAQFTQGLEVGNTTEGIVTSGLVFGLDVSSLLMAVAGPSQIKTLEVTEAATIRQNLNVDGPSRMQSVTATDASLSTLETSGAAAVGGQLDVAGAATVGSTLDVTGRVATEYLQLDTNFVPNGEPTGMVYWDQDAALPAIRGIDGIGIDLSEKETWYVKNQSGASIAKGSAVYAAGTLGSSGQLLIGKMIADGTVNAKYFLGITQSDIDNGGNGYVVSKGKIRNLNTTAWNEGDVLYVDENVAGALSDTEPQAPNLKLPVAFVVKSASNGTIAIRQTAGTYLAETHDVQVTSPATNELLARTSSGRWENVALGDIVAAGTEKPAAETSESFTAAFGTNSGTIMGEPDKWMPITIGGVNYLMPLYLAP